MMIFLNTGMILNIDAHQIFEKWQHLFTFLLVHSFVNYIRSNVQRKAKFCTLLIYVLYIHHQTHFSPPTCIQNLAAMSVFHDKFNSFWFIMPS